MQIVIEGFYSKDRSGSPLVVKGHFVTQKIDIVEEKGFSLLQVELGPQLKRLEIGEKEGIEDVLVVSTIAGLLLHCVRSFLQLCLVSKKVEDLSVACRCRNPVVVACTTCFKVTATAVTMSLQFCENQM
jgi:hypothetical protein